MFEKMRTSLSSRLVALRDRYNIIEERASVQLDDVEFAMRAGLSMGENAVVFEEIATKAREQSDLCGQAISGLLIDRTLPLIFTRSVGKAERFADQCEQILDGFDSAIQVGKIAFNARMRTVN